MLEVGAKEAQASLPKTEILDDQKPGENRLKAVTKAFIDKIRRKPTARDQVMAIATHSDEDKPKGNDMNKIPTTFYKEGPITPDELKQPADFEFRLEEYAEGKDTPKARFRSEDGVVVISAHFPSDVRSQFTSEKRALFDFSDDGKNVSYPKKESGETTLNTPDNQPAIEGYKPPLKMHNMEVRDFSMLPDEERNATVVTPGHVADMIRATAGEKLVIYTGAGISKGLVWDMAELQNRLHIDAGSDAFLQALVKDPEALREAFEIFDRQINTPIATPAHMAIKEIMDAMPEATLMTQNGDRNHEKSGIRPIHMSALPEFYEFLKNRTDKASLVITAGLNGDDVGFLNWVNTHNPNVKIVAVDLGKSVATYPKYINKNDAILSGDAHETLPAVAEAVNSK